MQLFYKAKHAKTKQIATSLYRFLTVVIIIVSMAFFDIRGILSFFTYENSVSNSFTVAGTYTVRFNSNDGQGHTYTQTIYRETSTNLDPNTFTRTGYNFVEWNTAANGSGTSYIDEESVTNLTSANSVIDLYAQWNQLSGVAMVNGVTYQSLQAAINAVPDNGPKTVVTLLTDIDEAVTVGSHKNILFDLQNYTITNTTGPATITNSGKIEIQNGTITKDANVAYAVIDNNSGGTLKITGGSVIGVGTFKGQAIYNCSTLEISGNAYIYAEATNRDTVTSVNGGTTVITGGTIISENQSAVSNVQYLSSGRDGGIIIIGTQDGLADITTPVIQGKVYGVHAIADSVELYDGILKGDNLAINDQTYITAIEPICSIDTGTEVIGSDTYETLFLVPDNVVTFDANGGSVSPSFKYIEVGDPIGTLPTPTWSHHMFTGWFTDPTTGTQITEYTLAGSNDIYYAHWKETCEITFYPEQGTVSPNVIEVERNTTPASLPTPTRTGYIFDGWFTAASGGTQITTSTIITQDTDAYAHWHLDNVRAYFDPNQGTVDTPYKDVPRGTEIGSLPTPTRSGFYFNGWFTDPTNGYRIHEDEIVNADTYYYARWISDAVARIDSVYYATLQDAVDDVPTDNTQTTITLLKNDLEAISILDINKNIILDLDGYTLYNNGSKNAIGVDNGTSRPSVIENSGTLKIINGTITTNSSQSAINTATGTVTIEDVTISHTGTSGKNVKQAIYMYSGTVIIKGNSVLTANNSGAYGGYDRGVIQVTGGTAIIRGGTISSATGPGIVNQASGTLILGEEDGTAGNTTPIIQGHTYGVKTSGSGSSFRFYDGIVKGVTDSISGTVSATETGATRVDTTDGTYYVTYYQ